MKKTALRLPQCPVSPNCVCSQDERESHRVDPLPLIGNLDDCLASLWQLLEKMPRTRIVKKTRFYLHVECASFLFRWVDDVEFLGDSEANVIHLRSCARKGYWDLGVNRRRLGRIRLAYQGELEQKLRTE